MTTALKTIGIIGAGQMGSGIAHVCSLAGYDVLLNDVNAERIKSGLATINGNMARQVSSGKIKEAERKAALDRIVAAPDYDALAGADLVIEAASENEASSGEIFTAREPGPEAERDSRPPTPRRSRSPGWPPPPTGRTASSASTS